MIEDPLFEPWFVDEEPTPTSVGGSPSDETAMESFSGEEGTVEFLRAQAVALLHAVGARLRLSHHETSVHDHLDQLPRLVRFELEPWAGPLSERAHGRVAMLEIGLSTESADTVTAWQWLDRVSEAPSEIAAVHSSKLTVSWLESIILDFVAKVLARR